MKIFKTVPMTTWDIGVIKISVAFMAFAIGSTWPNIFAPYAKILFTVGILTALYALYTWVKK